MSDLFQESTTLDQPRVLPCVRCERVLDAAMHGERDPYPATVFTSTGNYGSTLFDPSWTDRRYLRVHICDECLADVARRGFVQLAVPSNAPIVTSYSEWTPESEAALEAAMYEPAVSLGDGPTPEEMKNEATKET